MTMICVCKYGSGPHALHLYAGIRAVLNGLEDHAVFVGEFDQLTERGLRGVGIDIECQADILEADRAAFETASRPAAGNSAEFALIAKMAASVDTLDGFLREMKMRFPDATARAPLPPCWRFRSGPSS